MTTVEDTHNNPVPQAQQLIQHGRFAEAETILRQACAAGCNNEELYQKLGVAVALQGRRPEAIDFFRKAIETNKQFSLAYNGLALALSEECQLDEAESYGRKGLEIDPLCLPLYSTYAKILKAQSRLEEAESILRRALELYPQEAALWINLGAISGELRRKQQAVGAYEQALKLEPLNMELHDFIAEHTSYDRADNPHIQAMELLLTDARLQGRNAANLTFALAKAYENLKHYETAFQYLDKANALVRSTMPYNHNQTLSFFDTVKSAFNPAFFERNKNAGLDDETPIFVIGMPRSGTSLLEQILASHTRVFGAGELNLIYSLQFGRSGIQPETYIQDIQNLLPQDICEMAEHYLSAIKQYAPDARRIVDKMPQNFQYMGLIHTLFPKARIIHCIRDKRDVMFSIFKCNFKGYLPYAFNLDDIADFYAAYETLMDHWRSVLPGRIFDLRYEDLIENQEDTTKALLNYCGLEWQNSCLEFHKTKRSVTTASAGQVQKPLYKRAIGYWKHFEPWLPKEYS